MHILNLTVTQLLCGKSSTSSFTFSCNLPIGIQYTFSEITIYNGTTATERCIFATSPIFVISMQETLRIDADTQHFRRTHCAQIRDQTAWSAQMSPLRPLRFQLESQPYVPLSTFKPVTFPPSPFSLSPVSSLKGT